MADAIHGDHAFGAPGIAPRWTSSAKDGIGTAYHTAARCWFTLSHGIANEIYSPTIDRPNTRDLQLLLTDGETFFHEEKRDLEHHTERLDADALGYRQVNTDPDGRYRVVKEVITDPHQPVFLMRVRVEVTDKKLRGKLRAFVLLAPHLGGEGGGNSAAVSVLGGQRLICAWRGDHHLALGARPHFLRRSVGFAGESDGWQDLSDNLEMDWRFQRADGGNVAVTAELDLSDGDGVVVGVGFGDRANSAACALIQCLAEPFDGKVDSYIDQWRRVATWEEGDGAAAEAAMTAASGDGGKLLQLSRQVILAHEDKTYQGAMVASLSIPWGQARETADEGGYHLVWPRDMFHSAMALLATGHHGTPRRALAYLATIQEPSGDMPQNCWIDGRTYWPGEQLDEVAAPLMLAWHLKRRGGCDGLDTWPMLLRGARKIILHGPVTGQDRWEENSGYSPSTLAALIGALVAVADVAEERGDDATGRFVYDYADWLASHLEDWTVTDASTLVDGHPRHYVRIVPAEPGEVMADDAPDTAEVTIKNGGGTHPARHIVGGDFLHLVRYGIRPADDPVVLDSLKVIDAVIRHDLPTGPGWQRYNHDGYGQRRDGEPFEDVGLGGAWPLLTGERGVYAVAAGDDAGKYIHAMEAFANCGGMLPEQLWTLDDLPEKGLKKGEAAGSAMPLCWAHAEYLNLCRSAADGRPFDRIDPAYERYVQGGKRDAAAEVWTFKHPVRHTPAGRPLRVILDAPATVRWTVDGWGSQRDTSAEERLPGVWSAELPGELLGAGCTLTMTFKWADRWEGRNVEVAVR